MYFKKLEIFGFKSFADKTVLNFEPGITAIVGPNGCGKSNIFDSIRWVLGEQSIRELRGHAMEDVIFNGTEKKPSLGFAEVNLTFSNESKMLPIEQDEVTITRRLFRSGESEYLLNKSVVRLKDVQELLMGTGIGAEAYSLIQQGKVDLIVNSKPEDRRMVLDEASGITKYKSKKREALNKLKDTENNLIRVTDITTEVKRQIGSIERQARKAKKYKEKFERLKFLEIKLSHHKLRNFSSQKNFIDNDVELMHQKESTLTQQLEEYKNDFNDKSEYTKDIEHKINETREESIKLEGQIDLRNGQITFNRERIEDINNNAVKIKEQKEQLIGRCQMQEEKFQSTKTIMARLQESIEENQGAFSHRRLELEGLDKTVLEAKECIAAHEEKSLTLTSRQARLRNELNGIVNEIHGGLARKRRLELEKDKVFSEKQDVDEKLKVVDGDVNRIQEEIDELIRSKNKKDENLTHLKIRISGLEKTIDELDKKKVFFNSQKEFIEKMQTQYNDIPDPIIEGRLFTRSKPLDHHTGILGKVKDVRSISSGDYKFLNLDTENSPSGTSSHKDADLDPSSGNVDEINPLYEIICEAKFIELDLQQMINKINEIATRIKNLLSEKKDVLEQLCQERNNILLIDKEMHVKEKSRSVFFAQREDVITEVKKIEGELELVNSELFEIEEILQKVKKKEADVALEVNSVDQEIEFCQETMKEEQVFIASKLQEREKLIVSVAQMETELESDKDKLRNMQEAQSELFKNLNGWSDELKRMDAEASDQKNRQQKYMKEVEGLLEAIEAIGEKKGSISRSLAEYTAQKEEVSYQVDAINENIRLFENDIKKIKQEIHNREMVEQKIAFGEKEIKDRMMQIYKINYDEFMEGLENKSSEDEISDGEQNSLEAASGSLKEESQEPEAGEVPHIKISLEDLEGDINIEEFSSEIEKIKKQCDSFGSVNLVAIEEYAEMKERFEFLTKQQSDLLEAKSQLMSTIKKINKSTRLMFLDTFTKVSQEFRIYYRMLFGGGEAELVLLDTENVLESGIDIIAKPPGKKLQNISLLSGGEKTLTAIALIFGIFKVNPSPFCVLDEIDAALDESNIGRFVYLLKDFAKIAQFIIITHSKKTITGANVMYGITMPETGISRIVSVKFSEKEKAEKEKDVVVAGV